MRALLRSDGILQCMEVLTATVHAEDQELILENTENIVTVGNILRSNAEAAVRALYQEGKVDLTMYPSDI